MGLSISSLALWLLALFTKNRALTRPAPRLTFPLQVRLLSQPVLLRGWFQPVTPATPADSDSPPITAVSLAAARGFDDVELTLFASV
jgi:hypothetical protein